MIDQIKCAPIEIDPKGKMKAILAYYPEDGKALPLGVVTYDDENLCAIHVSDDYQRQGIGTKLIKAMDKYTGKQLIDDGNRTVEGSRFLGALKRPKGKNYKKVSRVDVLRAVRGICLNYFFYPVDQLEVIEC